jgi:hypothetical protein
MLRCRGCASLVPYFPHSRSKFLRQFRGSFLFNLFVFKSLHTLLVNGARLTAKFSIGYTLFLGPWGMYH